MTALFQYHRLFVGPKSDCMRAIQRQSVIIGPGDVLWALCFKGFQTKAYFYFLVAIAGLRLDPPGYNQ